MAGIRAKNTKPEMFVRKALHARGFRFRLHNKKLPGKPDLVLPKYRAVILCTAVSGMDMIAIFSGFPQLVETGGSIKSTLTVRVTVGWNLN